MQILLNFCVIASISETTLTDSILSIQLTKWMGDRDQYFCILNIWFAWLAPAHSISVFLSSLLVYFFIFQCFFSQSFSTHNLLCPHCLVFKEFSMLYQFYSWSDVIEKQSNWKLFVARKLWVFVCWISLIYEITKKLLAEKYLKHFSC